jgi:hypothetical protein
MGINGGIDGSLPLLGLAGVGIRTLNMANQAQADMAEKLLLIQAAQTGAGVFVEAKGMFVDTHA